MQTRTCSSLEILENRIAPAGVVTAVYNPATFELTLTGDGVDNLVEVFQTGPNSYRVEGTATNIFDGVAIVSTFLDIGKLTKLTYDGGAGADNLVLTNLRTLTSLSISGGIGDDGFAADNLNVKGAVELHGNTGGDTATFDGLFTTISGNVTIDSAAGAADSIQANFNAQKTVIGGSVLFTGGGSSSGLSLFGEGPASIAKGIDFNASAGSGGISLSNDDLLTVGKLPSGESVLFTGGASDDVLAFQGVNVTLAGGIRMTGGAQSDRIDFDTNPGTVKIGKLATGESIFFDGGTEDDDLTLTAANATLAGGIDFVGGDGENEINMSAATGIAKVGKLAGGQSIRSTGGTGDDTITTNHSNFTLAGGIEFAPGDGTNLIDLLSDSGVVKIGKLTGGQSILFNGGVAGDTIGSDIARATLAGGVELNGGGGNNRLEFDDDGVVTIGKFGTGRSILFTGTGNADNELDLGGFATLAGSIDLTGGTSGDDIDLDGKVTVGKDATGASIIFNGGDGNDEIDFNDRVILNGSLKFDAGNDNDTVDWDIVDTLTIKGAVEMIGGAGTDAFNVKSFGLVLGSTFTFTGGDGADTVLIEADGSIAGNVSIDLGIAPAGAQNVTLTARTSLPASLLLKGSLTIDADAANTTADNLTITNVAVTKLADIALGGGVSTVNIDNLNAGDEFKLDTGNGADVVNIERGNFFGGSVIKKLATILLGDGNDQLLIGGPLPAANPVGTPDSTRVNFLGGLTADGGLADTDSRNDIVAENDGVLLAGLTEFEVTNLV